ncbi:ArgE/DapE family deacylase [Kribbella sandramycini]|uniref:Probable succinyl-diaminopimelate desuccinylase n=1 Tax=Kribbella sandramycini TaxID=60450 RepID=A0A7Y4KUL3_9ACTN|nr:ArgE/DapE family deacylase [Kribbella sandramycini]MBB6568463.1 acetylornithine deacetylase [Kribbella sandramycini]NOL38947.1 ArgE/DapE family deacylase [Kribbella sandramycini]
MVTAQEQAVLDRIDEEFLVEVCTALVRATGQNPPGEEAATVAVLAAVGAELGLEVTTAPVEPGRDNISLTVPGGDGPGLLLLGHTDVVPVGEGWTKDPYGAEIADGRIYGRGSSDMKGGLAAAVAALAALRGAGLSGPVELAAVIDEEETGKGIQAFLAANERRYAACITAEPTDLQTIIAARGDSYLRVAVHGRAVHAGNAKDGANAIYGAAAIIAEIERLHAELATAEHPLLGPATWSVGQINGGIGGSIVPAECVLIADRRLLPGESPAAVLDDLRARVAALRLEDRGLTVDLDMPMEMPPFETPADAELVRVTEAARREAGGPELPLAGWGAACDGGYVARDLGLPVVVLGPGSVLNQAHRADESVPIAELVTAARTYVLAAIRLLT